VNSWSRRRECVRFVRGQEGQSLPRGILVGDNSGSGNNLKVERAGIGLVGKDDLAAITWDEWEVIERGYGGES